VPYYQLHMKPAIILEQFELGAMANYVYFIGCSETREVAIVDPGWDMTFLFKEATKKGYKITAVLLTHGHPDHIEGLEALLKRFDVPVYLSEQEAEFFMPECKNLQLTKDHEIISVGKIQIECLHTPGHTSGCQCYHIDNILLTGDVLFVDSCGRCDLPGGSSKAMYDSLYNIILKLPDATVIYPGHRYGRKSFATLCELKTTNLYLTCKSLDEFINERL
jgi:hydroxyacylglutathione hydrolase